MLKEFGRLSTGRKLSSDLRAILRVFWPIGGAEECYGRGNTLTMAAKSRFDAIVRGATTCGIARDENNVSIFSLMKY